MDWSKACWAEEGGEPRGSGGRPGADIFANSGAEQLKQKLKNTRVSPDVSPFSVDLAKIQ